MPNLFLPQGLCAASSYLECSVSESWPILSLVQVSPSQWNLSDLLGEVAFSSLFQTLCFIILFFLHGSYAYIIVSYLWSTCLFSATSAKMQAP